MLIVINTELCTLKMASTNQGNNPSSLERTFVFKTAISNILKNIVESVSEEGFAKYFEFLNLKPKVTQKLYDALKTDLYKGMDSDFETIITEDNLVIGITEIMKLIDSSSQDTNHVNWRPPGDVQIHLKAFDMIKMQEEYDKLSIILKQLETENDSLLPIVEQKRIIANEAEDEIMKNIKFNLSEVMQREKKSDRIINGHTFIDKN